MSYKVSLPFLLLFWLYPCSESLPYTIPISDSMDFSGVVSIKKLIRNSNGGLLKHKTIGILIGDRIVLTVLPQSISSSNVWIKSTDELEYVDVSINGPGKQQMQQIIKIKSITRHDSDHRVESNGGKGMQGYDLALVELREKPINRTVMSIANFSMIQSNMFDTIHCVVLTWNISDIQFDDDPTRTVDRTNLRFKNVSYMSGKDCKQHRPKDVDSERMFCSERFFDKDYENGPENCEQDLSAPYMCFLHGSWHVFGILSDDCSKHAPTIYTDLTHSGYKSWIANTTNTILGKNENLLESKNFTDDVSNSGQLKHCEILEDKDVHGAGLPAVNNKPFSACCDICRKTSECKAYAWNDYEGGTCWLKKDVEPIVEAKGVKVGILPSMVSRISVCDILEDRYIEAEDIGKVHGQSLQSCCPLCHHVPECQAYVWNDYLGGTCWLKKGIEPIVEKKGVKVGIVPAEIVRVKKCAIHMDKDVASADLQFFTNKPAAACCSLCQEKADCTAYTWADKEGGTCWLKNHTKPLVESPGMRVGIVTNIPEESTCQTFANKTIEGYTIETVNFQKFSDCCHVCFKKPYCKSYTWSSHWGGACELKGATGPLVPKSGVNSGLLSPYSSIKEASDFIEDKPVVFSNVPLNGITGRVEADPKNFPWVITIKRMSKMSGRVTHVCFGALISRTVIVTTAYCLKQYETIPLDELIVCHASTKRHYGIKNVVVHQSFDPKGGLFARLHAGKNIAKLRYDISLVQLKTGIKHGKPIQLSDSTIKFNANSDCLVVGTGKDYDHVSEMRQVSVPIVSHKQCYVSWPGLDETMICAGESGKDESKRGGACADAVGAPLACKLNGSWHLVGISSFGTYKCLLKPTVFSRIRTLRPWIESSLLLLRGGNKGPNQLHITIPSVALSVVICMALLTTLAVVCRKKHWQIPTDLARIDNNQLKLIEQIGEGNFGEVWKGEIKQKQKQKKPKTVAIKVLKLTAQDKEKRQFLEEAFILGKLKGCKYIVSAVGLCLESKPNLLVLEYMNGGCLDSFLHNEAQGNSLQHKQLLEIARDVCKACCFLEEKGYIHRDIAARNCLIKFKDQSSKVPSITKLCDFGLAKDEKTVYMTSNPELPVAWAAPETFNGVFFIKSDVWSYGVLLWEIFSYCAAPYGKCSMSGELHMCPCQVFSHRQIEQHVCQHHKTLLDLPDPCTGQFTEITNDLFAKCWHYHPDMRPSFSMVCDMLMVGQQRCDIIQQLELTTSSSQARLLMDATFKVSVATSDASGIYSNYQKLLLNNFTDSVESTAENVL